MLYLILKTIHLVAVVMFLGNITTGIFWKEHADRSRDPRIIAHMIAGISASDRIFTVPGVFLILLGGVGAAMSGHLPILRTGWILWAIVLFSFSGVAFMTQVAPLQRRMTALMRAGADSGAPDWNAYHDLSRRWALWGALALLAPLGAMVLMVLKPSLPSF
jgi:uncharacterized membrane protein